MLKKVTGAAKDRLKQRLHHGQHPMPSKPRSHRHKAAMPVSLSAVDNAAFENILDDDTEFLSEVSHNHIPPSTSSSISGFNSPKTHLPTSAETSQEADIFNTNTFLYVGEHKEDRGKDVQDEDDAQGLVNCDPLSGQIVSERVKEEEAMNGDMEGSRMECEKDSMHGNEEENSIGNEKCGNGNEVEDRNLNKEETRCYSDSGTVDENGARDDPNASNSNVCLSEYSSDDVLFDNEDRTTEPILIPVAHLETTCQSPPLHKSIHCDHQQEFSYHSESGLSGALSDASPLSSFPSSLENELRSSLCSPPSDSATHPCDVHEATMPHQCARPPHFPADCDHTPIIKCHNTASPIPPTHSHDGSPSSGTESELEQLLTSSKAMTSSCVLCASEESEGKRKRSSSEREGSGPHLDSGVFDHYGTESDSTPEREGHERNVKNENDSKEKVFVVEEDHFSASHGSSLPTTPLSQPEDHTHYSHTTPLSKSDNHSHSSPVTHPLRSSVSSVNSRGRSRSKAPPPPRPPLSFQVRQKINAKRAAAATDQVKVKYVQPLGRTKPWNQSGAALGQNAALEERVVADDLFSQDTMKPEEVRALTVLSDEVEKEREMVAPAEEAELCHVKSASETARLMESVSKTSIISMEALTVSDMEDNRLYLTLPYHIALSVILYFYYSFNIFPYLAGLLAGFFTVYLFFGSVFIYYVLTIDKKEKRQRLNDVKLSDDFVRTMKVDFSKLKVYQVSV